MVAVNRKNNLMEAMLNWVIRENRAEIGKKNGVNLGALYFYTISSNPKKWVGDYGRVGYHGSADGKILVRNKGEERIAARILNFPADRLIHKVDLYDYDDTCSRYIFIFDGDWVKVCPGLYYSKELDNYYWTGEGYEDPTWHGSKYSDQLKLHLREYKCYTSNKYFWDWCEENSSEDVEEVAIEDRIRVYSSVLHNAIIDLLNPECDGEIFWEERKIGDFKDGQGYFYSDDVDALKDMVDRLYTGYTCRLEDGKFVFREGWVVE